MSSRTYNEYIAGIERKLSWDSKMDEINGNDIADALADAVDLYSRDRPLTQVHAITGDGTHRYSLPADWADGFSSVVYIEYPAGSNANQEPTILDPDEVTVWQDDTGYKFHFRFRDLTSSDEAWVKYTTRHTVSTTTVTVPDADYEAIVMLSSAFAALTLAGHLMKKRGQGASASGQMVSFRTTSDEFRTYSQELFKLYFRRMGIGENGAARQAAMEIFDLDYQPTGFAGGGWLTHTGR